MADVHTKAIRSYNMSKIRSKDTKPEILIRKVLFARGYRFRLHSKELPGKPDIILPKYKTAIFVHGCFWHSHAGCKYATTPKTRIEWWQQKLNANVLKDAGNETALINLGWTVITIWECSLKSDVKDQTFQNLFNKLQKI